jgi:hypothetical protein
MMIINPKEKQMDRTRIPRDSYRGSDPKKRARLADEDRLCSMIEAELRRLYEGMKPGESLIVISESLAHDIKADPKKVRELIYRIDAGSNGVTLWKPKE